MTRRQLIEFYCGVLVVLGLAGAMVASVVMTTEHAADGRVEWGRYYEGQ